MDVLEGNDIILRWVDIVCVWLFEVERAYRDAQTFLSCGWMKREWVRRLAFGFEILSLCLYVVHPGQSWFPNLHCHGAREYTSTAIKLRRLRVVNLKIGLKNVETRNRHKFWQGNVENETPLPLCLIHFS